MRKTDGLGSGDITSLSFSLILPGFEPATAPSRVMLGKSFFLPQFIISKVISKNYNLLVEVPFYTEDMVSKYLNYFDSLSNAEGERREARQFTSSGSHELREAAVHRYGEGKLRHVIRLRDALIEAYAASPVLFRGD